MITMPKQNGSEMKVDAVNKLIPKLYSEDSKTKWSVAQTIGDKWPRMTKEAQNEVIKKALKVLVRLLEDNRVRSHKDFKYRVADAAAHALSQIKHKTTFEPLNELLDEALKKPELNNSDYGTVWYAANVFRKVGGEHSVPYLTKLLNHQDPRINCYGAQELGETGSEDAVPHLKKFLDGYLKGWRPRKLEAGGANAVYAAMDALGKISAIETVKYLKGVKSKDPRITSAMVNALRNTKDEKAVPPLVKLLNPKYGVSGEAAYALLNIGREIKYCKIEDPYAELLVTLLPHVESGDPPLLKAAFQQIIKVKKVKNIKSYNIKLYLDKLRKRLEQQPIKGLAERLRRLRRLRR